MGSSILDIGKTALQAAQVGIAVTGHNIANAATPGYSRQEVIQSPALALNQGFGYVGQGTQIVTIQRIYSELLTRQVASSLSTVGELDTYTAQLSQINNLLANSSAGLAPAIQDFFDSVQSAAANPGDAAARQSLLSSAQALASRFQGLDHRLGEIESGVNAELNASVSLINTYANQIAQLNVAIEAASTASNRPPNDLLDQRDQLVADLSRLVKVDVVQQDDGKYNIFIGNGQSLVVGNHAYSMTTVRSATDPSRLEVGYINSTGDTITLSSNSLVGGVLGGLIQFREQSLDSIRGQLGLVAVTLGEAFNAQHMQGYDQNGSAGGVFFSIPAPAISEHSGNSGDAVLDVAIDNVAALTGSNYYLRYDGTNYTLTRTDNGAVQTLGSLPQIVDGVELDITTGSMQAGDSFLIRPTATAAGGLSLAISDIHQIALAELSSAGDADNGNALALAALQTAKTALNGSASFEDVYAQLVSRVGNKTNELKVMSAAENSTLDGMISAQQSVSGVNLDEEATNLLRYQQAYQAAGKVMQIASQLFDLLLTIGH